MMLVKKNSKKVRIFSTDRSYFKYYVDIIRKYSNVNPTLKSEDEYIEYMEIEVNSLDFLPRLEQDLLDISPIHIEGLVFSTNEDGYYLIEIYNGYRE